MPFLVRLIDSEIEMLNVMFPKVSDGVNNLLRVAEQICSIPLVIKLKPTGSDLYIYPVYRYPQRGGKLVGGEHAGGMFPP